jgi:hypothetical protein
MDKSINGYQKQANAIIEYVWFEGTDALKEGEAVCYNTNYGTATARDGRRCNRVERPSTSNNKAFAGVAARDYPASSVGQLVEINVPGSKSVNIALGADTVIDTGILTFQAGGGSGAGRFVKAGYAGRGSIVPRQTVTAVVEASMTGAWSLAVDGKTLTVSDTAGLSAGDTVVLLGGKDEGSSKAIVPGKYLIASITSGTVLVLATSAVGATPNGALTCTGYAYTGNPKCQADLLEGEESGGVQFVSPPATGGAAVMGTFMSGGVTYVCGGLTVGSAVANGALANGDFFGQRKGFIGLGTLTTNGVTVTPAAAGIQRKVLDAIDTGAQGDPLALALITIDAAGEYIHLQWWGTWAEQAHAGATLAAS